MSCEEVTQPLENPAMDTESRVPPNCHLRSTHCPLPCVPEASRRESLSPPATTQAADAGKSAHHTWPGESSSRLFSKNRKWARKESALMASMCAQVTPLTSCPVLENKNGVQEKWGAEDRNGGAGEGSAG